MANPPRPRAKPLPARAPAIWMALPMTRDRRMRRLLSTAQALALLAGLVAPVGASHAGWRDEMKSFRIGLIAEPGAGQSVTGLATLKQAYAQALGIPVEIFVARDYAALIDAQATARIDYAVYSTTAYATTVLLCGCVEPVAALDSVAGFALPRVELAGGEVTLTGSEPFLVHVESASAAEAMLVDGSVDAIFGWVPANAGAELAGGTLDRLQAQGLDRASLSGGVEMVAAQIRSARSAFESRRRAAADAPCLPDGAQRIAARRLRSP